jgi:hypothetical protein
MMSPHVREQALLQLKKDQEMQQALREYLHMHICFLQYQGRTLSHSHALTLRVRVCSATREGFRH